MVQWPMVWAQGCVRRRRLVRRTVTWRVLCVSIPFRTWSLLHSKTFGFISKVTNHPGSDTRGPLDTPSETYTCQAPAVHPTHQPPGTSQHPCISTGLTYTCQPRAGPWDEVESPTIPREQNCVTDVRWSPFPALRGRARARYPINCVIIVWVWPFAMKSCFTDANDATRIDRTRGEKKSGLSWSATSVFPAAFMLWGGVGLGHHGSAWRS